jgi:hypothetical protein
MGIRSGMAMLLIARLTKSNTDRIESANIELSSIEVKGNRQESRLRSRPVQDGHKIQDTGYKTEV